MMAARSLARNATTLAISAGVAKRSIRDEGLFSAMNFRSASAYGRSRWTDSMKLFKLSVPVAPVSTQLTVTAVPFVSSAKLREMDNCVALLAL